MIGLSDFETVARLGLRMLIVVYNDSAYGAEVHHFGPHGAPLDLVQFAEVDFAALGRAVGLRGATVRRAEDVRVVSEWLDCGARPGLVLDAKVVTTVVAEWLEEKLGIVVPELGHERAESIPFSAQPSNVSSTRCHRGLS